MVDVKVDYNTMPGSAKNVRDYGNNLNRHMTNAYQYVAEMHTYWYGTSYNEVVKKFNSVIPMINEMLKLVVTEIPSSIETAANNYSSADRGSHVTTVDTTEASLIGELTEYGESGAYIKGESVSEIQGKIEKCFEDSCNVMNDISGQITNMDWESEAATNFRDRFNNLKTNIETNLTDIKTVMAKEIVDAQNRFTDSETASNVNK